MSRKMAPVDEQIFVLMSGVDYGDAQLKETFEAQLRKLLEEDRPLRVYLGIDPTATSLTLGHTVPLRKLRQFQQFGHHAIFLIGDYTALIGDPSDKNKLRPMLTQDDIIDAGVATADMFPIWPKRVTHCTGPDILFDQWWSIRRIKGTRFELTKRHERKTKKAEPKSKSWNSQDFRIDIANRAEMAFSLFMSIVNEEDSIHKMSAPDLCKLERIRF